MSCLSSRRPHSTATATIVSALLAVFALIASCTATLLAPATAQATTYQIRSQSAARATQHLRSDNRLAAPRMLSQSLTLSAYDLRDDQSGDLNARISMRYSTDLGLATRFRDDPLFEARFNDITLDIAYLQWRPYPTLELSAGRQWHRSPLGITDYDGLAASWESADGVWRPFVGIAAGRDVQRGLTPVDPGAWDVQGLPPNEIDRSADPWHLMAAANAGIRRGRRHRLELASEHHRRPRASQSGQSSQTPDAATTHRVGATATTSPADPVTVTATTSFHSAVSSVDRARLDAAWRLASGTISAGLDHRRPVFDSASIFNLFGAQPHRGAYATYSRPIDALSTTVELRGWSRLYFDDDASVFDPGDARALGAALANRHRLELFIPFDLRWQLSAQTLAGQSGGDQYLARARLRAPGPVDGLYLTGRLLGLWALPDHHRRNSGYATTAALGAELALGEVGNLFVNVESRSGSLTPYNTAVFALFELEAWR